MPGQAASLSKSPWSWRERMPRDRLDRGCGCSGLDRWRPVQGGSRLRPTVTGTASGNPCSPSELKNWMEVQDENYCIVQPNWIYFSALWSSHGKNVTCPNLIPWFCSPTPKWGCRNFTFGLTHKRVRCEGSISLRWCLLQPWIWPQTFNWVGIEILPLRQERHKSEDLNSDVFSIIRSAGHSSFVCPGWTPAFLPGTVSLLLCCHNNRISYTLHAQVQTNRGRWAREELSDSPVWSSKCQYCIQVAEMCWGKKSA